MVVNRRSLLKAGAVAGAIAIGPTSIASGEIDSEVKPEHVSITYDETLLEEWQPLFKMSLDAREKHTGTYGYVATSSEWSVDVLAYWSRYAIQEGFRWLPWDSHQYDHEPVYLFLDSDQGTLEEVVYAGYHHYAARVEDGFSDLLVADRASDPTHISLRVVPEHHHYRLADPGEGHFTTLRSWIDARSEWESYGFYEGTSRSAVDVPETMRERSSWWEKGTLDERLAALSLLLNLDPEDRDELEVEK